MSLLNAILIGLATGLVFGFALEKSRVFEPGAIVGEMSALLGRPASASVRARTPVTVYAIDDPEKFFEKSPAVLLEIARTLARRLDATTAHLADNRHRFAGAEDMVFLEDVFALLGNGRQTTAT